LAKLFLDTRAAVAFAIARPVSWMIGCQRLCSYGVAVAAGAGALNRRRATSSRGALAGAAAAFLRWCTRTTTVVILRSASLVLEAPFARLAGSSRRLACCWSRRLGCGSGLAGGTGSSLGSAPSWGLLRPCCFLDVRPAQHSKHSDASGPTSR